MYSVTEISRAVVPTLARVQRSGQRRARPGNGRSDYKKKENILYFVCFVWVESLINFQNWTRRDENPHTVSGFGSGPGSRINVRDSPQLMMGAVGFVPR